ncbi:MAG: fasciclin domain-containing protein [Bacteroidia bacterium]|nr:fasciclin domain-containing protein [Bacteroidia bacterium]
MKKLKFLAIAVVATSMLFVSCKEDDKTETPTPTTPTQKTIAGIASGDTTFSILVAALTKADLVATLNGTGNFTVFAPTNSAFRKYGITEQVIAAISDADEIEELKGTLLYHVLGSEVKAAQLTNAYVPTLFTVGGNGVSLQVNIAPVKLNATVNVTTADVDASNGVVHIIDDVLFPPTVVDIAANNPLFTSLVAAVTKAELVETLSETENLTVFAPVNQAFTDINFDLEATSKEALTPILTAHVLGSSVRSGQIMNGQKATTLNTAVELTFNTSSGVKLSGGKTTDAEVVVADIQAVNGVVHVINKVIVP